MAENQIIIKVIAAGAGAGAADSACGDNYVVGAMANTGGTAPHGGSIGSTVDSENEKSVKRKPGQSHVSPVMPASSTMGEGISNSVAKAKLTSISNRDSAEVRRRIREGVYNSGAPILQTPRKKYSKSQATTEKTSGAGGRTRAAVSANTRLGSFFKVLGKKLGFGAKGAQYMKSAASKIAEATGTLSGIRGATRLATLGPAAVVFAAYNINDLIENAAIKAKEERAAKLPEIIRRFQGQETTYISEIIERQAQSIEVTTSLQAATRVANIMATTGFTVGLIAGPAGGIIGGIIGSAVGLVGGYIFGGKADARREINRLKTSALRPVFLIRKIKGDIDPENQDRSEYEDLNYNNEDVQYWGMVKRRIIYDYFRGEILKESEPSSKLGTGDFGYNSRLANEEQSKAKDMFLKWYTVEHSKLYHGRFGEIANRW